jgi:YVTN family beta-propeller protein
MRKILYVIGIVAVAMILAGGRTGTRAQEGPYRFIKDIPVGGEGGWDYASVDPAAKRLYVTHGTRVVVIDTEKDAVVGEIGPTPGVHGFAIAAELGKGFASAGGENKAAIVDLKTLEILSKVDTGANPDCIFYEPVRQEVYTFNGRDNSSTVFDAKTGTVVATIKLSGRPEFAQSDPKAGRIYNNIEDKNEVAVIDTKTHTVVASWPIAPGEGASGMAIDLAHHRLFIGCSNSMMVMMDSTNGKVLGNVPIGPGVDANNYDPVTNYAFASSGGDGTVTVAQATSATDFKVIQTLKTQVGSRTMTLDPKTHKLYLAAAQYETPATPPQPGQRVRRTMVPGSFKVLVYGMTKPPKG